jgi:hypothetical protein
VIRRSQKWNSALGAFFALAANLPALAQIETQRAEVAEAVRVDRGPKLDGTLDDPLWQSAKPIGDFRQQEPYEGQPATERTEVRILYTRHAVYFGIRCFDSEPSRIIASELRRDVSQDLDDHFEILIDSNHDRRGAYVFQINPLGTQVDGLIVEEQKDNPGTDFDPGWDGVWTSEAHIGADGWTAPIVGRIQMLWETTRETAIANFAKAPGLPKDKGAYLHNVDEIYKSDAYHSLSIEGYSVTPELIERVRQGNWNPERDEQDKKNRDALAARGYWQAFQLVKVSVGKVIGGAPVGLVAHDEHKDWYRQLFQPCVTAGLMRAGDLAGYRNSPIYLRTSRYVPPRWKAVRDAMPMFFDLLEKEPEPSVRAVLGHWLFGYIHPYPDGNGRMARFLMNVMLASGGYPWTVIRLRDRKAYLAALDSASIGTDLGPFTTLIGQRVRWAL